MVVGFVCSASRADAGVTRGIGNKWVGNPTNVGGRCLTRSAAWRSPPCGLEGPPPRRLLTWDCTAIRSCCKAAIMVFSHR